MGWVSWILLFAAVWLVLIYNRASLNVFTLATGLLLAFFTRFFHPGVVIMTLLWVGYLLLFFPLRVRSLRYRVFSKPALDFYRSVMPSMSRTEKEALAAGTVGFEGELFSGAPDWQKLLKMPVAVLSSEEKAFLEGPVETLCAMINDWDITHVRADMPPEMWQFLKDNKFFGMMIPKSYGGLAFSAYAHSQVLIKIYGCSPSVATTVSVPNSLGPAELLLHYGTEAQKNYYLPRLARGEEIPCFALTGPDAGSDAGSMPDTGIVCKGLHEGREVIGIRLTFSKRYITLAPVATLVGLAFKLIDPEGLLGGEKDRGITCALIPRNTPGVQIGRRHFPLGVAFQNGPIQGKNIFIPAEWIIGGPAMAGQGWHMLMECLAAGRAISLPSASMGGTKMLVYTTGAYARIRRQFGVSIGQFEGIQDVLARIAGTAYTMDATRTFTAAQIDAGGRPAVASAISKLHVTEMGRRAGNDAMDIHGGKGICLGPRNYIGRAWQSIPVAITVEGANILTRCLIVFGQGAMRCHPWILAELEAAQLDDPAKRLQAFDRALTGHMGYSLSNVVRSLLLGLTGGRIARVPGGRCRKYFRKAARYSAAFAMVADISLLLMGGSLKRRESISARLGDILSQLYMLSAVLKHYGDQGAPQEDFPVVSWAAQTCVYEIEQAFDGIFRNYPSFFWGKVLRFLVFPFGKHAALPSDRLGRKVAALFMAPSSTRTRLAEGTFITQNAGNMMAAVENALLKTIAAEPFFKMIHSAVRKGQLSSFTLAEQAKEAFEKQLLTREGYEALQAADAAREQVINVDDFAAGELTHAGHNKSGETAETVRQ